MNVSYISAYNFTIKKVKVTMRCISHHPTILNKYHEYVKEMNIHAVRFCLNQFTLMKYIRTPVIKNAMVFAALICIIYLLIDLLSDLFIDQCIYLHVF